MIPPMPARGEMPGWILGLPSSLFFSLILPLSPLLKGPLFWDLSWAFPCGDGAEKVTPSRRMNSSTLNCPWAFSKFLQSHFLKPQDLWPYLEKKVLAGVNKLRISTWDHPGLSLNPMTSVFMKDTQRTGRGTRKRQSGSRGRDWSYAATGSWERKEWSSSSDFREERGPGDILILDFWSPELWKNRFLLI